MPHRVHVTNNKLTQIFIWDRSNKKRVQEILRKPGGQERVNTKYKPGLSCI